jgi:nucleotide-binding universal stress UspA family protein
MIEAAAASVGAEPEAVPSSSVGRGLHELAEETGADLVVVGSSHLSRAGQVLAGNVGQSLLHGSPCSVAVASHGFAGRERSDLEELVVGYDGSDEAGMAVDDATGLARGSGALLKLVTVAEPPPTTYGKSGGRTAGWHALKESVDETMRQCLDEGLASLPADLPVEGVLAHGDPAEALAELANAGGALLMLGSRAYGPLRRVLLGTVATKLVRTAPCPVVVHPRPARESKPAATAIGAGSAE